jgi:malic enzyme
MFLAAARAFAECVPLERLERGGVYPALTSIRDVCVSIAVARAAGLPRAADARGTPRPATLVRASMYEPAYGEAGSLPRGD